MIDDVIHSNYMVFVTAYLADFRSIDTGIMLLLMAGSNSVPSSSLPPSSSRIILTVTSSLNLKKSRESHLSYYIGKLNITDHVFSLYFHGLRL